MIMKYNNKEFNKSSLSTLNLSFESEESIRFINDLSDEIIKKIENSNKNKLKEALASLCAEMLEAAAICSTQLISLPMGRGDFTGMDVGYRPCKNAIDGLRALKYIEYIEGYCPISLKDPMKARTSRLKAKPMLIELAASYGITPLNWQEHFKARPWNGVVDEPLVLKARSKYINGFSWGGGTKVRGPKIEFDPLDSKALAIIRQVEEINLALAPHDIQPAHWFRGFQRIFALGTAHGYPWDKGGRLYAVGGGGYQQVNSDRRATMTFNDEPVAEIDIKASHLTICHAMAGKPLNCPDPYAVPGIERAIVKKFVTITLGKGKPPRLWPDETKEKYAADEKTLGSDLQKDHPIGTVRKAVLKQLPLLAEIEASPYNWADFQYAESQAIIEAVHTLTVRHGIPALAVHDSIMIPVSQRDLAKAILSDAFYKYVRITPILEVNNVS